eukprot:TRINITY_DN66758_c0_g2_i1.p1 TRINITY_DN66758_c0_g2~~TRINITY_DN66758_c0_g2_i1.p1  ORF type:complete len:123 (+),score=7.24 TRINITY_DN66758_c0_g2_i1:1292-1660(+)
MHILTLTNHEGGQQPTAWAAHPPNLKWLGFAVVGWSHANLVSEVLSSSKEEECNKPVSQQQGTPPPHRYKQYKWFHCSLSFCFYVLALITKKLIHPGNRIVSLFLSSHHSEMFCAMLPLVII